MKRGSKALLEHLYIEKKMSIPDIAKMFNMPYSATRRLLIKSGIALRSRADGMRAVAYKISLLHKGRKKFFSETHRENIRIAKAKYWNNRARGYRLNPRGYLEYTTGEHKGRLIHVVLAEKHILGRRLVKGECVHHKDENKTNNAIENLQVMTNSEHTKHHAILNYRKRSKDRYGRFT